VISTEWVQFHSIFARGLSDVSPVTDRQLVQQRYAIKPFYRFAELERFPVHFDSKHSRALK
jgi:hypothetical protein